MKHFLTALLLLTLVTGMSLRAGDKGNNTDAKGFRKEFLSQMEDTQSKIMDLAGAIPAESYGWRPMDGVRSVSEVYMHIALSNYMFANFAGTKRPDGIKGDMEKTVTEKAKVLEILKQSFDQVRTALDAIPDDGMEKEVKMFGGMSTLRNVFFTTATHMHEHLGQSIAYARMNKIVPPWTAAEEAAAAKDKK